MNEPIQSPPRHTTLTAVSGPLPHSALQKEREKERERKCSAAEMSFHSLVRKRKKKKLHLKQQKLTPAFRDDEREEKPACRPRACVSV